MARQPRRPEPEPEFERLASAAVRKGFSVDTFRHLISTGKLRAYRLSDNPRSTIRVRISDVDALFSEVVPAGTFDR